MLLSRVHQGVKVFGCRFRGESVLKMHVWYDLASQVCLTCSFAPNAEGRRTLRSSSGVLEDIHSCILMILNRRYSNRHPDT